MDARAGTRTGSRAGLRQGPGPKGAQAEVRRALLAAGGELYEERGLEPFALWEVAERAGVTQAMVRYYFGDRQGFLAALLDDGFERLFAAVPADGDPATMLERVIAEMNRMRWLVLLMMQCVYASGELRSHFMERHMPRIAELLGRAVARRGDLDARLSVVSLISMLVFPQLARPVIGPAFGLAFDEGFAEDFAGHIGRLFAAGA